MAHTASELGVQFLEKKLGVVGKHAAKCDQHGDYVAIERRGGVVSGCPQCAEERAAERERAEAKVREAERARRRLEQRLESAAIPPRFAGKTFDAYQIQSDQQQRAQETCQAYASEFERHHADGRCLLLLGNVGTGKTHLAAAIANQIIRQCEWATVLYRTVSAITRHVRSAYGKDSAVTESEAFGLFAKPSLLIIDEAGASHGSDHERMVLFEVINMRYEQQLPTVVISNLGPKDLPEILGLRTVDRLREESGIALVFNWESARSVIGREGME